jgi:asparagine synthase (glutamine-hydrolysing)
MCGICGIVAFDDVEVERDTLESMSKRLAHRGPDSHGSFRDGAVGLASRRLAIVDLVAGDQPITNEDGSVVVVQNGEIYNYRELRDELERHGHHRFSTSCDTEVLVHLYEQYGTSFVERLRGMFALALWDRRARRLVLARDRFGIKPLYYRLCQRSLSFASELKALLCQPGFRREIDLDALGYYLAFSFVPAPLTIFREVRKLEPGSRLVWEGGRASKVRTERYAEVRSVSIDELRREDDETLASELQTRLRDSVRAHLIADVPVGVLLSGGVDSSTIAALAAEQSSKPVSTFTIGFQERGFDERKTARLVSERYGTDHHELVLRPNAVELLPELAVAFDEPFADASAIPTYLVSQLARGNVKVALSGEGGDELFGGYNYYVGHLLAPRLRFVAAAVRPLVERLPSSSGRGSTLDWQAKRFVRGAHLPEVERHCIWKTVFSPEERSSVVEPEHERALDAVKLLRVHHAESQGAEELTRAMDLDLGVFLVDDILVKLDRATMAHSLEARVPILDPLVAELALSLPVHMKVRGLAKKRVLRQAAATLLPEEVLNGRKRGFVIPLAAWLRRDAASFARDVLSAGNLDRQGFFRADTVARMIEDHTSHRADHSRKIWALLAFSLWHDHYMSGSPSS